MREELEPTGITAAAPPPDAVLRMRLVGRNSNALVAGVAEQPGTAHYFRGEDRRGWRTNVPTFAQVHYSSVYPGIDLLYYGRDGQLEYDFRVAPGADPSIISMDFEGATHIGIDESGDLVLDTPLGRVVHRKPLIYQMNSGGREVIEGNYVITDERVGFAVGPYDTTEPLVIDPVLAYSTYFGGTGGLYGEQAYGIASDGEDNVYVTGITRSAMFPVGQPQAVKDDVFVVKIAPSGALVYVAIIGGNSVDSGEGIAVTADGEVAVVGFTDSTNFPTVNPIHGNKSGRDGFLVRLDTTGALTSSTYLGGSNSFDYAEAVAIDSQGNAYVTGVTKSGDFPVLDGYQPSLAGQDAFVVKVDPTGGMLYGTYLGGSKLEAAESIVVDEAGSFYVTGWTTSTNFPRVQSSRSKAAGEDVFVSQFAPDGSLAYSGYLGGNANERPYAITLDGEGGVFVGGWTNSTNFPSAVPLQGDQPGTDAFVTRLVFGDVIAFSTYLGGDDWERVLGLAVRDGRLFVTGQTFSSDMLTVNAFQPANGGSPGSADAFVTIVDVATSVVSLSTYLGGAGTEEGRGAAALPGGNVVVAGWTESTDFPTSRPIQSFNSNTGNVFISRVAPIGVDAVSPSLVQQGGGTAVTISGQDFLAGATVKFGGVPAADVVVLNGSTLTATAPSLPGTGEMDVTVTNPDGGSGTLYSGVTALNGTGPVAHAGPDQSVEATMSGAGTVILDGTGSFDPDTEPLAFEWRDAANNIVATGALTSTILPLGDHTITLIVSDGHSTPAIDTVLVRVVDTTAPVVEVVSPNGGNKIFTGTSALIEWSASDGGSGLQSFDVYLSTNGGSSYGTTPICASVPGTQRTCSWASPGPTGSKARIRVVARDAAGNTSFDNSNSNFTITSGSASVTVTSPNTAVNWGAGSTQRITWKHNLGAAAFVRLDASFDGGVTWNLITPGVRNSTSTTGAYDWTLPATLSTSARVRASWAHGAASDQSNVDFTIASPFVQVTSPGAGGNWGHDTRQRVAWTTNLGAGDTVDVLLSTDGGATFPTQLAAAQVAGTQSATIVTPAVSTAMGQVRVLWTNAPSGFAAGGTSAGTFTIAPPFVIVTSPNGGESWPAGKKRTITWSHNLGALESVRIELSQDDGATYPVVVAASAPSDGSQALVPQAGWITSLGRIRITWLGAAAISDTSDESFIIR
jgi:hypothetical protein